jgi:hypothetical protein
MSKALIGDQLWAEMTEGQKVDAVLRGDATLTQMREILQAGSGKLRDACQDFLANGDLSIENLANPTGDSGQTTSVEMPSDAQNQNARPHRIVKPKNRHSSPAVKQKFGLPKGFVPRLQRYGRSVLLELNVYRLPDGPELIPCRPTGTLGTSRHLYALLTSEQYLQGRRGSVYVRTDGRIFDYSVDSASPLGDIFDTGYTINDLERTGRYAPALRRRKKKTQQAKVRRAAAASG